MASGLSGQCLCGKISYKIERPKSKLGACHCTMCRRWSGGVFIGLQVAPDDIEFEGAEHLASFASSDWAERAFCTTCGANMYYRVTAPGPYHGVYHVGSGTLDEHGDLKLVEELFIDIKPQGYSFAEKTHAMTNAEVAALFADADGVDADSDGDGD
ncbi:MAG: GFA family protein [Pseudomonadota bacterium]